MVETETPKQLTEVPPLPTIDELNQQFSHLCAKAGQLQFEIKVKEHQLAQVNQQISEVNQKALALSEQKKEVANG